MALIPPKSSYAVRSTTYTHKQTQRFVRYCRSKFALAINIIAPSSSLLRARSSLTHAHSSHTVFGADLVSFLLCICVVLGRSLSSPSVSLSSSSLSPPVAPSHNLDGRVGNDLTRQPPAWREAQLLSLLRLRPAESGTRSFHTGRSVSSHHSFSNGDLVSLLLSPTCTDNFPDFQLCLLLAHNFVQFQSDSTLRRATTTFLHLYGVLNLSRRDHRIARINPT